MINLEENIILCLQKHRPKTDKEFQIAIRKHAGQFKQPPPAKNKLLAAYKSLINKRLINSDKNFEKYLIKKAVRTLSGVAPITVMTAPLSCPYNCLYCPNENNMPKSYLSNQPAAMRAVLTKFHPYKQVYSRIAALQGNGHNTDKIEIIINGGTWSSHPKKYQTWFIYQIFKAANDYKTDTYTNNYFSFRKDGKKIINNILSNLKLNLKKYNSNDDKTLIKKLLIEQKKNEIGNNRIIGITLETRPDLIDIHEIQRMRKLGATKIEIGTQNINDNILKLNKRGHGIHEIIKATKLLKDAGFKVCYHMMPGLYKSTIKKDKEMFIKLFKNPAYKPDFLKIYPCVVLKNAQLYKFYKNKKYTPYKSENLIKLLCDIKKNLPNYVRIVRLVRDIPSKSIIAGNKITNLREIVHKTMRQNNDMCKCIRCMEAKNKTIHSLKDVIFKKNKIKNLDAIEYFLRFMDKNQKTLYAFLRLRLPQENTIQKILPALKNAAIIRELHTYGKLKPLYPATSIKQQDTITHKTVQHMGLGKKLMLEAEKIAKNNNYPKIAVISGIGVRGYYKKLGYYLKDTYMLKKL
jgi:elongator complex protein 3